MKILLVSLFLAAVLTLPFYLAADCVLPSSANDALFPPGSGLINVSNFGARGDGSTDDTAAIKAAVASALSAGARNNTLYFPAGTYIVSDTFYWAEFGTTPAVITANVNTTSGCVTGFNMTSGGAGYRASWVGGPGLLLVGGGGSGTNITTTLSGSAVGGFSVPGGCSGIGYTAPPTVKAVNWRGYLRWQGQNSTNTVIKLKDNTFTNGNCSVGIQDNLARENCRAVIYTASEKEGNSYGNGESAYGNDIWNLTIDTGSGNAGAIALDWLGSNEGSIKNVILRSTDGTGRCGLNLSRSWGGSGGGPGLIKNVTINGFDYGIRSGGNSTEVGYTLENITLNNQRSYGIFNKNVSIWFRKVISTNTVPAVVNQDNGSMVLIDSVLGGGDPTNAAILNQGASRVGQLFARNVTTSGYQAAIKQGLGTTNTSGLNVTGLNVVEYTSSAVSKLFGPSPCTSRSLTINETPDEFMDNDFSHWAVVTSYGATPNDNLDDTAGINAALAAGRPIVYLPAGTYKITGTLQIPSGVRKIFSPRATITSLSGTSIGVPAMQNNATTGGSVEVRNFMFDKFALSSTPAFRNNGSVPLILASVFDMNGYDNNGGAGTGDVYLEDAAICNTFNQVGGHVWARQWDGEAGSSTIVLSGGATAWVLGYKTETANTGQLVRLTGGSILEILGGFNSIHGPMAGPAYSSTDSAISLAGLAIYPTYSQVISETRTGTTQVLNNTNTWVGGTQFSLYTGY